MSATAASTLQSDADALDRAARAGDGAAVSTGLRRLRSHVAAYRTTGELSADRAARIVAAAVAVAGDVPVPAPVRVPTVAPIAPPSGDGENAGEGDSSGEKRKGRGKKD